MQRQEYKASTSLIRAILNTCPPHIAVPDAPEGANALTQFAQTRNWKCYRDAGWKIKVSSLHSDNTIWPTPEINHAFRAMHDSVHAYINAPFTLKGEYAVALKTNALLSEECEYLTAEDRMVLWFEVVGQAEYHHMHGEFPKNQAAFIWSCIHNGLARTLNSSLLLPY